MQLPNLTRLIRPIQGHLLKGSELGGRPHGESSLSMHEYYVLVRLWLIYKYEHNNIQIYTAYDMA